ncbi:MFS transporter [Salibacterium halotolerans]|uniref:Predicted arabinose efflux permease, MFS family n=1 Tax=Salibacterium halotolerans TaxID=1884432 RepID=A0A1I5SBE0_9BACI|nr:MFS transporter [Salibacterium halotolerans]SFP68029.1 Predicted arabinose efflux permease, MFS family [Salibacterium halotolerans]
MNANKLIFAGLPMIAVTYGLSRFSYGLMLPYINETINMNQTTSGVISSLSYVAYCIAIAAAMVFSHKVTSRVILIAAGLLSIIGLGAISISMNPVVLGLGIFLAGMSTGLSSPPYADIVSKNVTSKVQNQTNSWINSGTSIGTAFTGAVAMMMVDSWRITYVIFMAIAVVVLVINYNVLPRHQTVEKKLPQDTIGNAGKQSLQLISASLLLGLSCAAYWTFSRDFILSLENVPAYLGDWLWIIIGLAGLLGGTAGVFINRFGIRHAFRISAAAISTSSFLLGIYPGNAVIGFLSPFLFGSSYVFMTGVLIVWGVSVFRTNPSLGLGVPFLVLAFGQAAGSILAGMTADLFGYQILFLAASVIGYLSMVFQYKTD